MNGQVTNTTGAPPVSVGSSSTVSVGLGGRTHRLTGVVRESGTCDRCSRELGKVYQVTTVATGEVQLLGRRCCTKVTGYTNLDRLAGIEARCAELGVRREVVAAAYPELAAAADEYTEACAAKRAAGFSAEGVFRPAAVDVFATAYTNDCWWGGAGWSAYGNWDEYVAACLRRAAGGAR